MARSPASPHRLLRDLLARHETGLPLYRQAEQPRRGGLPPRVHLHDNWELKIALRGRLHCPLESGGEAVASPALILVPPGRVHTATLPEKMRRGTAVLSLFADQELPVLALLRPAPEHVLRRVSRCMLSAAALQRWQLRLGRGWNEYLDSLMQPAPAGASGVAAPLGACRELGVRFFLSALCLAVLEAEALPSASASLVERAERLMRQQYHDPGLSVKGVAEALQRTPTYLAGLFRRERGTTVRQALVRIRLERAHALLERGGLTVKEVASLTGWGSQHYFANCFRKTYGYAPSSIRPTGVA